MDRRIIPPKQVIPPNWGPPPLYNQALKRQVLKIKAVVRLKIHFQRKPSSGWIFPLYSITRKM